MMHDDPALDAVLSVLSDHELKKHAIEIQTGLSHAECERVLRLLITTGQVRATGGGLHSCERYGRVIQQTMPQQQ